MRVRNLQLDKLEQAKSVVTIGVQVDAVENTSTNQDSAKLKRKIELLEKQVQALGEYNEELREKYEPENELETEEDDDDEDEEEDDDGFEILDPLPGKKVTSSSKGKEAEPSPMEATPTVIAPMVTASTTCARRGAGTLARRI